VELVIDCAGAGECVIRVLRPKNEAFAMNDVQINVGLCGYRKPLRELRNAHEPSATKTQLHNQATATALHLSSNHLTGPHLRARRRVRSGLAHVGIDGDSRVALSRVSRNGSKVVAAGSTSSRS
jgi:hypothetical protein